MLRHFHNCLLLAASLLLASCTAVEFAYNNAPAYLAGEFDDAFDVDDAQSEQVDLAFERFFEWHRQYELERYHELLDSAAMRVADGIRADEFMDITREMRSAWHRSLGRLADDFAPLLATLSPEQIDHYEAYFRERSEEYEDYLAMDAAGRKEYRVKRGLERLEDWFGELSERQREDIGARLLQLPEIYPDWIAYREARQRAFVDALRRAPVEGLPAQRLRDIALDPDSKHARAFQSARSAYWLAYAQMIEDINGSLTSMQLQHAVNRLRNYADGVGNLARAD
jgi:hypothetical protein